MPILTVDYTNLNHDEMARKIGLKESYMPMLIGSFLEESIPTLASLKDAIANKEYNTIRFQAHSIKGSSGNLRFTEIYEMSKEMEEAASNSDSSFEYGSYLDALVDAIETIKA